jgi:hypothetical protein
MSSSAENGFARMLSAPILLASPRRPSRRMTRGIVIPESVDTFGNTCGGCPQGELLLTFNVRTRVTTSRPQCQMRLTEFDPFKIFSLVGFFIKGSIDIIETQPWLARRMAVRTTWSNSADPNGRHSGALVILEVWSGSKSGSLESS